MDAAFIIFGIVFVVAAVIALVIAFADETLVALGVAVVLAAAGTFEFVHGIHGVQAKFHHKHLSIMRDLRAQGFNPKYQDVYAVGGNQLYGTEYDVHVNACEYPLVMRKLDGVWRPALLAANGNGVVVMTPKVVASLPCPG